MSKMSRVNRAHSERYECHACDKTFKSEEVEDTWECPDCDELIIIYGKDSDGENRITLQRKKGEDITRMDQVHRPGELSGNSYQVLGVTKLSNGNLRLGLRGFGAYDVEPDEAVNCRFGSW